MKINIDKVEFDKQFSLFIRYVLGTSGEKEFKSFSSNTFTQEQEGYKYEIYDLAREALSYKSWTNSPSISCFCKRGFTGSILVISEDFHVL